MAGRVLRDCSRARFFCRRCAAAAARPTLVPSSSRTTLSYHLRVLHCTAPLTQESKSPPAATSSSARDPPAGGGGGVFDIGTALRRVGRGILLTIPIMGAGFAADLMLKDYRRARKELSLAQIRLALAETSYERDLARLAGQEDAALPDRPTLGPSPAARYFGAAAAANTGTAAAHLVALYGLYQGWAPEPIVNALIAAVVGASMSTGGGVRGEYLVAGREVPETRITAAENQEDSGGGSSGMPGKMFDEHATEGRR